MLRMVRSNLAVWVVAVAIVVATVVAVVVTGHRQGENAPGGGGPAPSPLPAPVRAVLTGLGLGPEIFQPHAPAGSAPVIRSSAGGSPSSGSAPSTASRSSAPILIQQPAPPPVSCQVSLLGSILGLLTSLLGGGAGC
jgi:hypothetical protein